MEIKISGNKLNTEYAELGDIVEARGRLYLVVKVRGEYVAKCFGGSTGLNGVFKSLSDLNEALLRDEPNFRLYKKSEYQLVLQRKR